MRFSIWVTLPFLIVSLAGAQSTTSTVPLELGAPAPPVTLDDGALLDFSAGTVTLIEFVASWCPASRHLLAMQDSMLAAHPDSRCRIVAISQEHPALLGDFVQRAGWTHLTFVSDQDKLLLQDFVLSAWANEGEPARLPFAFILGDDPAGNPGRILWMGPVVELRRPRPLERFQLALRAVREGAYDLDHAIELARQQAHYLEMSRETSHALRANDLDRLETLLGELATAPVPEGLSTNLVDQMNSIAWGLISSESTTGRQVEIAYLACQVALSGGGESNAYFLDTYALVLFERGDLQRAVEIQTSAVQMSGDLPFHEEAVASLARYREAAGLPADEPASASAAPTVWRGTMDETFDGAELGELGILVGPDQCGDDAEDQAWRTELGIRHQQFYSACRLVRAQEVTESALGDKIPILYGTPSGNPITQAVLDAHDIEVTDAGVRFGKMFLPAENPILITSLPNPWNPSRPVKLYTASRPADAHELNRFRHGSTALVIGHWQEEEPVILYSADYWPATSADDCARPQIAPAVLTTAEAGDDLQQLHQLLAEHYAGYQDLAWEFLMNDTSWEVYTQTFLEQLAAQPEWAWADYYDLLSQYLGIIQDTHFRIAGSGFVDGVFGRQRSRFVRTWRPYFADGFVVRAPGNPGQLRFYPSDSPDHPGHVLEAIPEAVTPYTVTGGSPYLFPTLPKHASDWGQGQTDRFLLGVLIAGETEPDQITVRLAAEASADGESLDLPVHRGRLAASVPARGGWELRPAENAGAGNTFPVLAVRTMSMQALSGMVDTADSLRLQPRVVLDLRQNPGGSDMPAMLWCARFGGQPFLSSGLTNRSPGATDHRWEWDSRIGMTREASAIPGFPSADLPYSGKLFIFVDKGVASSGETFAQQAEQIPGAVLLGENTSGCVNYGNVTRRGPLKHSRIDLAFGYSRFVVDWVRPNREGIGFFPDYWLDVEDPVAYLEGYLAGRDD